MRHRPGKRNRLFVDIAELAPHPELDRAKLRRAVRKVFADADITEGRVSLAVVDNATIAKLNRKHLHRRGPTDVLAYNLHDINDAGPAPIIWGEIVVSAEEAQQQAKERKLPFKSELLLYVIHGALHLVGFDDQTESDRRELEDKQGYYLDLVLGSKSKAGAGRARSRPGGSITKGG